MKSTRRAFTLIELLVVVAIIGILAAIAAVNYLEASTRSRVSRVRADMRTIGVAIESYRIDNNVYPRAAIGDWKLTAPLEALTRPTAYLAAVPEDPFGTAPLDFSNAIVLAGYLYKDRATTSVNMPADVYGPVWRELPGREWFLHSSGPNRVWDVTPYAEYDPTNGTISRGDIFRAGP